ncbi:MAG TPA: hypothetical protein VEG38_13435, partial [Acidimicrobiia bacterium]|nr:hypothetical protein [Acidimicrobiia bacterium]
AQTVGYLLAAGGPSIFGVLRDVTHAWAIPLAVLLAVTAAGGIANGVRLRLDGWGIETTVIGAVLGAMAAGLLALAVVSLALRNRLTGG